MFATRNFGVPSALVAVLLIVAGILVIVFPAILVWTVGLTMILVGALWLVSSMGGTTMARRTAPPSYGPPP